MSLCKLAMNTTSLRNGERTMRTCDFKFKALLKATALVAAILLLSAGVSFGQQVVNLTAGSAGVTLPDGTGVPMWGYTCGTVATGSTATCAALNPLSAGGLVGAVGVVNGGSAYTSAPGVMFTGGGGTGATAVANIQGGQVVSVSLTSPGIGYTSAPAVSFSGGGGSGATATAGLAWSPVVITVPSGQALTINLTNNLYSSLLTGTGTTPVNPIPTSIMIVGQVGGGLGSLSQRTTTPSPSHANSQGCVTWFIADTTNTPPGTPCTTDASGAVPPVQGPRVQSLATEVAPVVAGSTTAPTSLTWSALRPGTYLLESATHPSIQVPMGLV